MAKAAKSKPTRTDSLVKAMLDGHSLSLSRLLTLIENRDAGTEAVMRAIFTKTGNAQIWGITGPPGAGKSTIVDCLTTELRKVGKKVAILAVDPSSPFSGGALLGDRIRMQKHATDSGVFIRSIGTRGRHGGLSHSTRESVMLLDAAGFDVILVETAGVGQTELDISTLAESVVVVLVPESGDSIQMMKAGLMEIADVFVVNKSDRPGADQIVKELVTMIGMVSSSWAVPITKAEGIYEKGIAEIVAAVTGHQQHLDKNELRKGKRLLFLKHHVQDILKERLDLRVEGRFKSKQGSQILKNLITKKLDPYKVAKSILTIKL